MSSTSKLRQLILNADDTRKKTVVSSHWKDGDGKPMILEIRSLPLRTHSGIIRESKTDDGGIDNQEMTMRMMLACVYDPAEGCLVFEDADREMIGTKNSAAVAEIMAVVQELNGLTEAATEQAEKN